MSANNSSAEITCPTTPGLASLVGFAPGLDWSSVKANPSQNWHVIGWCVCALLVFITWITSIVTINRHFNNYYQQKIQKHKLRVLLFPPLYSTLAWFSYLRYDYSTTIMLFATLFEAFAVFNLFHTLQAYLKPAREEHIGVVEPQDTKIMFLFKLHLKSKWGKRYTYITEFLVLQYPIWSIVDSILSIIAEVKGRYCEGIYSFKGAYVYLTVLNFISLSIILTALFTYLDVYKREWGTHIKAHGMFWCVKGPIMFNFYFGEILLTILTSVHVIKGTDGTNGSIPWPTDAVKNGLSVIIVCFVMLIDSFFMCKYFGPKQEIDQQYKKRSRWYAFKNGYAYFPVEIVGRIFFCFKASDKRVGTKQGLNQPQHEMSNLNSNSEHTTQLLPRQNSKNGSTSDSSLTMQNSRNEYPYPPPSGYNNVVPKYSHFPRNR